MNKHNDELTRTADHEETLENETHLDAMRAAAATASHLLLRWHLIRARRRGLTLQMVAERMGIPPQAVVTEIESPNSDPHLSMLRRYALAVGAIIEYEIFTETTTTEEDAIKLADGREEWWLDGKQVTKDQAIAAQAWDEGYRATGYEPSHGENPYKPCTCCQEMTDTNNTTP